MKNNFRMIKVYAAIVFSVILLSSCSLLGLLYPAGIYQQFIEDELYNDGEITVYLKFNGTGTPYINYYDGDCGSNYTAMSNVYENWYAVTLNGTETSVRFNPGSGFSEVFDVTNTVWFENVHSTTFNVSGRPIDSPRVDNTNINILFKKPSGWSDEVYIKYSAGTIFTAMNWDPYKWYEHTFTWDMDYTIYDYNNTNVYTSGYVSSNTWVVIEPYWAMMYTMPWNFDTNANVEQTFDFYNGQFEDYSFALIGWAFSSADVATSHYYMSSSYCLQLSNWSAMSPVNFSLSLSNEHKVSIDPDKQYEITLDAYNFYTYNYLTVQYLWYKNDGWTIITNSSDQITLPTSMQWATFYFGVQTPPSDVGYLGVRIVGNIGNMGGYFYIDNVRYKETTE